MKQIPTSLLTLLAGVAIALISLWVGQHHGLLPLQASEQAPLVDDFFNVMVTIATALFLVVEGAIVWFVIQFRKPAGDETDGAPIEGNFSLEIVWTAIPAIIVIGLGIYSVEVFEQMGGFAPAHAHGSIAHHSPAKGSAMAAPAIADVSEMGEPASPTAKYGFGAPTAEGSTAADLVVNVTGLQYAWLFNYLDSGVMAGELHVPLGKAVQLNISAQDVIHSFWVPQFRLKQDAIPGQPTELRFVATKIGTYPVVCAELCGGYHGSMRTQLIVHSLADYDAWLEENRTAQSTDLQQQIAVNPTELSESEFLAPYAQAIGLKAEMLTQIHPNNYAAITHNP
ncbi:cytochrome c oxidase subunit II [Microcoleus sp. F8-D3]